MVNLLSAVSSCSCYLEAFGYSVARGLQRNCTQIQQQVKQLFSHTIEAITEQIIYPKIIHRSVATRAYKSWCLLGKVVTLPLHGEYFPHIHSSQLQDKQSLALRELLEVHQTVFPTSCKDIMLSEVNRQLDEGTCFGQASAIILAAAKLGMFRANRKTAISWQQVVNTATITDELFFQIFMKVLFGLAVKRRECYQTKLAAYTKCLSIRDEECDLTMQMASLQSQLLQKKGVIPSNNRKELQTKIDELQKKIQKSPDDLRMAVTEYKDLLAKAIEKPYEKLYDKMQVLELDYITQASGLKLLACVKIPVKQSRLDEKRLENLFLLAEKNAVKAMRFNLNYHDVRDTTLQPPGHTIMLSIDSNYAIYDSQVGVVEYTCLKDLIADLERYLKIELDCPKRGEQLHFIQLDMFST